MLVRVVAVPTLSPLEPRVDPVRSQKIFGGLSSIRDSREVVVNGVRRHRLQGSSSRQVSSVVPQTALRVCCTTAMTSVAADDGEPASLEQFMGATPQTRNRADASRLRACCSTACWTKANVNATLGYLKRNVV
jgi:hypothetical protein